MQIRLWCKTHQAHVIPAGGFLNWIPQNEVNVDDIVKPEHKVHPSAYSNEFELDYADLYCTGGDSPHVFQVQVKSNTAALTEYEEV